MSGKGSSYYLLLFYLFTFRNQILKYNETQNGTDNKLVFVVPAFDGARNVVSSVLIIKLSFLHSVTCTARSEKLQGKFERCAICRNERLALRFAHRKKILIDSLKIWFTGSILRPAMHD